MRCILDALLEMAKHERLRVRLPILFFSLETIVIKVTNQERLRVILYTNFFFFFPLQPSGVLARFNYSSLTKMFRTLCTFSSLLRQ